MTLSSSIRSGVRSGIRSGMNPSGGMAGVTLDATANKYWPSTAAEWATARSAAGLPAGAVSRLWNMQDAAGSPVDSVGGTTLTVSGTVTLNNAFTGWSRKAINIAEGGASFLFNNSDTNLPDVSTVPVLLITLLAITATPLAERTAVIIGDGNGLKANITADPFAKAVVGGTTTATGASALPTTVIPFCMRTDPGATTARVYTLAEKLSPSWTALASAKAIFFGGAVELAPAMSVLGSAQFEGTAAQLSDAQLKSLLQVCNWSPLWS